MKTKIARLRQIIRHSSFVIATFGLLTIGSNVTWAAPSAAAGQIQPVLLNTGSTNLNILPVSAGMLYNLPGWATNQSGYSSSQSNAPTFTAVGARHLFLEGSCNLLASNTCTLTFPLMCSIDNVTWMAPPPGMPTYVIVTSLNQNQLYPTNNLNFGTNWDAGAIPFWAISGATNSSSVTAVSNLVWKAYTKAGGI